jgi:predicted dehydrogenase
VSTGVLLVGFGRRGRDWLRALRSRRGCEPAGAVDPDPAALEEAERRGLRGFATLDDALGATAAGAAIVCSPPALHASQAVECLEAQRRVLVEKPVALSLADAAAVAGAAERAGLPAVAAHNFRHRPLERAIRHALAGGAIGDLRTVQVASGRPAAPADGEHAPLWDLGVHHLDLLRTRLGGPPEQVEARRVDSAGGITYSMRLEWADAGADYWLREGTSVYHHAEWLEGSGGALRVVDGRVWLVTATSRPRRLRAARGPAPERVLLDALLNGSAAARDGREPLDVRESLDTIAIVEAAVRSIAENTPVRPAGLAGAPGVSAAPA